ncbi:MAG TPA: hypothetical protein VGY54_20175 [Polyangiaceae bacterium]|nr:hypothetical protein [Polyangiaceae bacterium]
MDRSVQADALVRATLSLADASLRAQYVVSVLRAWPLETLGHALDALCQRAEQADTASREALVAVVDAFNAHGMADLVQRLREQAVGESLLALERLIRNPGRGPHAGDATGEAARSSEDGAKAPVLPRGESGRPLTLGERKSLARRPDRETIQRLLADPHPDVIQRCLRNPRLTEDDLVSLAAKRPGRGEVLVEIARSRWIHRPRVRLAVVLNPATPLELAVRIAGLLLRPELDMVARSPQVAAVVRAVCLEHLARRPPVEGRAGGGVH